MSMAEWEISEAGLPSLAVRPTVASVPRRMADATVAAVALFLLLPLLAAVSVAIKLDSKGPIFFRQARVGRGGRSFSILKFRTMVPDAEARLTEVEALNESPGGMLIRIERDPRVTPLGRFLRRYSLDEVPQLVNVLRGEMSLVGPRPLQQRDFDRLLDAYGELALTRLAASPGLTGLAQVSGRRSISPREILELDRLYVERRSTAVDVMILFRTVGVVLSGRGAM